MCAPSPFSLNLHDVQADTNDPSTALFANRDHRRFRCSVVCVTSCPEAVDPVLRRPGRLHTDVCLRPPSFSERHSILQNLLDEDACDDSVDLESVAAASEGYTAADLTALCRETVRSAMLRCLVQVIVFLP